MATTPIPRPFEVLSSRFMGVNFWSRNGGPFMWRTFDAALVTSELRTMKEHGLPLTRSFFFWPDFHPEPYRIDDDVCAAFETFLDLHIELGMQTIPTFIVGHMSGQNWDPAWRHGRDLYTDVWMVGRQAWFIGEMVRRFHTHPAVAGWLISNEMPLYGGGGGLMGPAERVDGDAVRSWAELMVQAVRAAGGTQPVSLGDGAWGKEVMGADNGYRLSWTAPLVDWIGPHAYHMSDDPFRQFFTPAFNAELCAAFGRPVILEEFGVSSSFVSDDNAAHYYRQVLYSTLTAGVSGWIAWNNTDFDAASQEPYDHRPFEMSFGLTSPMGEPKPALSELQLFASEINKIDFATAARVPAQVGLVVSNYLTQDRPFWGEEESPALRDALLEAYIATRLADLPPALVPDDAAIPAAPLLIVPAAKAITAPGCAALLDAATAGSTVWVSYSVGETLNQRGWWWPDADDAFGVSIQSRYGLTEPITDPVIEFVFDTDFGDIDAGSVLSFAVSDRTIAHAFLPLNVTDGRVIARDRHGRPAIVEHNRGDGRTILCTYPLELLLARTPDANHTPLAALYRALGILSGTGTSAWTEDLESFTDVIVTGDGREHIVLLNTSPAPRSIRAHTATGWDSDIRLDTYGAAILATTPPATPAPH